MFLEKKYIARPALLATQGFMTRIEKDKDCRIGGKLFGCSCQAQPRPSCNYSYMFASKSPNKGVKQTHHLKKLRDHEPSLAIINPY